MEVFPAQQLQATPGKLQASDACLSPLTGFRDDLSERDGQRRLARRKAKQSNFGTRRIGAIHDRQLSGCSTIGVLAVYQWSGMIAPLVNYERPAEPGLINPRRSIGVENTIDVRVSP